MIERSPEVQARIIEGLSNGRPLAVMCREEGMPNRSSVYDWMEADEEFARHIARARDDGYDFIAARTRATARGKIADDGGDSSGDVQRDKLIIDTDLKLLAKWDPRRYGDAMLHKHADAEGGKIELDPVARATRLAAIFAEIEKAKSGDAD